MTSLALEAHPARTFESERLLRAVAVMHARRVFADPEEEKAFLEGFAGRAVADVQAEAGLDTREQAQELAFQAMEAADLEESRRLAEAALELDGENLDARGVLAGATATTPEAYLENLKPLLDQALAGVDPLLLKTHLGRMWGVLDARPFLRLKLAHALVLERMGRVKGAIRVLEELLTLDAGDHQQARYLVVRIAGAARQTEALTRLVRACVEDRGTILAWTRVQERVQAEDEAGAQRALALARTVNPHVEDILTGRTKMPRTVESDPAPGTLDEAVQALRYLSRAWTSDRPSMFWLLKQRK